MCGHIHADINMNLGGPAKVKYKGGSTELYADKVGSPFVKLFIFCQVMNKVALFHSYLCVGFEVWIYTWFYVNKRTYRVFFS